MLPLNGRGLEELSAVEMEPRLALTLWEAEAGQDTDLSTGRDAVPASHEKSHTGTLSSTMAFSSSLLHNAAFRHTWDTEKCPVYSIHISCGLAQKLIQKNLPFFPLLLHNFPQ